MVMTDEMSATFTGPDGPVEFARTERPDSPTALCD